MAEAAVDRALPTTPQDEASAQAPKSTAPTAEEKKHGLPPAGSVELRRYTDKEISTILASVPRAKGVAPDAKDLRYRAIFETPDGPIRCTLDHAEAPQASANFLALAAGKRAWRDPDTKEIVQRPLYDNLTFHRAIKDFIIQTGNPGTGASAGPGWTIPREDGVKARYEAAGAMGMVDSGEDTHGSQFFITLRGQKSLVGKYTPFGLCEDIERIRRIANAPKQEPSAKGKSATKPLKPVRVISVKTTAVLTTPPPSTAPQAPAQPQTP